jgi:hypothetical protein
MANSISSEHQEPLLTDSSIKKLHSIDKIFLPDDYQGASTTISVRYLAGGDAQALLEANAARAFKELSVKHARMRIILCKDDSGYENFHYVVQPELSDAAVASSIKVQRGDWKTIVMSVADTGFPERSTLPLFNITIIPPEDGKKDAEGHILFTASHALADGMGSLVFAYDFFAAVSRSLAEPNPIVDEPDQLFPDLFDIISGPLDAPNKFVLPAPEAILRDVVLPPAIMEMMSTLPVMPIHSSIPNFKDAAPHSKKPFSNSFFVSADGSPSRFIASHVRSKEESSTLNGAYTAAFAVAYSRVLESMVVGKSVCPLSFCFDYRIPGRTSTPIPISSIGNYFNFSKVRPLNAGIALDTSFWSIAREVNVTGTEDIQSDLNKFMVKFFDDVITYDNNSQWLKAVPGGVREGFVISNMGVYKGPTDIVFLDVPGASLSLTTLHTHIGINTHSGPSCVWMSTCAGKPSYSSSHKVNNEVYEHFFFNWVKVCEALGSIESNESVGSVADRLLGPQYNVSTI